MAIGTLLVLFGAILIGLEVWLGFNGDPGLAFWLLVLTVPIWLMVASEWWQDVRP